VSEEHITCFGWANTADLDDIVALTLRINDFLSGLLLGVGITLVDFKLEFGRLWENDEMRIILADEISPDNCRENGQGPFSSRPGQGRGRVSGGRPPPGYPAGGGDPRS
jgi:phosphoribosylaminoimidazole-succinocarboxamide synthase